MSKRKKHRHCHRRKYNKINTLGPDTQTCDLKTNITKHKKVKKKKKRDKSKHGGFKDFNFEPFGSDCDDKEKLSLSLINLSEETKISTHKIRMPTKKGYNSTMLQAQSLESDNENNPNCLKENKMCRSTVKKLILTNSSDVVKCDINIGMGRRENIPTEYKTSPSTQPNHTNIMDRYSRKQKKRHQKGRKTDKYENMSVHSHKLFSNGNDIEDDVQLLAKTKKKKKRCQSRQFIYGDEHQVIAEHQDNTEQQDKTEQLDNMDHRDSMEHRENTDHKNNTEQRTKMEHQDNTEHLENAEHGDNAEHNEDNTEHLNNQTNDHNQDKTHHVESKNYKYMVTLYNLWRYVIQQDIQIHNQRLQLEKTKLETKQLFREKLNQEEQLAELHLLVGSLNKIIEEKDEDISSLKQDFQYIQGLIEDNHGLVINHESLTEIQQRISDGVTMINSLANMLQSGMFDSK